MMVQPSSQEFTLKPCPTMSVQRFYDYLNISLHFALILLEKSVELKRLKVNVINRTPKA